MPNNAERVQIAIDVTGWFELSVDEVWPDGDAPEVITAEAVREVMQACGGKVSTLNDWELLDGLEVHAHVDGGASVEVWKAGWQTALTGGDEAAGPGTRADRLALEMAERAKGQQAQARASFYDIAREVLTEEFAAERNDGDKDAG